MKTTLVILAFSAVLNVSYAGDLPPSNVPGAINPNVTQSNIHQTICVSGWTKTIRPKVAYTKKSCSHLR